MRPTTSIRSRASGGPGPRTAASGFPLTRERTKGVARGGLPEVGVGKCLNARLRAPEDQRVNVVCAFVSIDGLQIAQHAHHVKFVRDAVAAVDVARQAGDVERLAAIVALEQ